MGGVHQGNDPASTALPNHHLSHPKGILTHEPLEKALDSGL